MEVSAAPLHYVTPFLVSGRDASVAVGEASPSPASVSASATPSTSTSPFVAQRSNPFPYSSPAAVRTMRQIAVVAATQAVLDGIAAAAAASAASTKKEGGEQNQPSQEGEVDAVVKNQLPETAAETTKPTTSTSKKERQQEGGASTAQRFGSPAKPKRMRKVKVTLRRRKAAATMQSNNGGASPSAAAALFPPSSAAAAPSPSLDLLDTSTASSSSTTSAAAATAPLSPVKAGDDFETISRKMMAQSSFKAIFGQKVKEVSKTHQLEAKIEKAKAEQQAMEREMEKQQQQQQQPHNAVVGGVVVRPSLLHAVNTRNNANAVVGSRQHHGGHLPAPPPIGRVGSVPNAIPNPPFSSAFGVNHFTANGNNNYNINNNVLLAASSPIGTRPSTSTRSVYASPSLSPRRPRTMAGTTTATAMTANIAASPQLRVRDATALNTILNGGAGVGVASAANPPNPIYNNNAAASNPFETPLERFQRKVAEAARAEATAAAAQQLRLPPVAPNAPQHHQQHAHRRRSQSEGAAAQQQGGNSRNGSRRSSGVGASTHNSVSLPSVFLPSSNPQQQQQRRGSRRAAEAELELEAVGAGAGVGTARRVEREAAPLANTATNLNSSARGEARRRSQSEPPPSNGAGNSRTAQKADSWCPVM